MKKIFLNGIIFGFGFVGTILLFIVSYAAWTNISTKTDGAAINATVWNEIVNKVNDIGNTYAPAGFIGAFNLTSCPTGWIAADGSNGTPDLRGQFLRGINTFNNGVTLRTDGKQDPDCATRSSASCSVGSYQDDAFQGHKFQTSNILGNTSNGWNITGGGGQFYTGPLSYITGNPVTDGINGSPRTTSETRPKNAGVIFCIKQ